MPDAPSLTLTTVNIAAPDPGALARFYSRLLGWDIRAEEPDWVILDAPDGGVSLSFETESNYVRPTWPHGPGDQHMMLHLEIRVEDLPAAVEHALSVGARAGGVSATGRRAGLSRPCRTPVLSVARGVTAPDRRAVPQVASRDVAPPIGPETDGSAHDEVDRER